MDGDGISNLDEYLQGSDPTVRIYAFGVTWVDLVGVTTSANTLTSTVNGWTGAASQQVIRADGAVEFTAVMTNTIRILGLSNINTDATSSSIDYGVFASSDSSIYIFENGYVGRARRVSGCI